MKTVGIKDLKNNLSAYLREVRRGTRILVSDRNHVVAELHEPGTVYTTGAEGGNLILAEWIAKGNVAPPVREKEPLPDTTVGVPAGTVHRLLRTDRDHDR
jgi:antitoxin (DNA-binding transcriptional repressor) of toxin-antitoxin stability system